MELGALKIKELEDVAKEAKNKSKSNAEESKTRDPPTPYDQQFFSYDQANSQVMDEAMKSQVSLDVPPSSPRPYYDPSGTAPYQGNQATPARSGRPQEIPPMPPNVPPADPGSYYPQQPQQQTLPDPPVEDMQKLEELKYQANQADRNATSAADHARAYAIQYEDLRAQAERAEIILNEKKPKKKGFFKGGKREAVSIYKNFQYTFTKKFQCISYNKFCIHRREKWNKQSKWRKSRPMKLNMRI